MNTNTLSNDSRKEAKDSHCIRLCRKECFGRKREYALFCNGGDGVRFWISVRDEKEETVGEVSCSFAEAAALFERIVRGEVVPYVLGEILEDFVREKE